MGEMTFTSISQQPVEFLFAGRDELLAKVEEMPMSACKYLASYYPDAHVRRAYLKRIGVRFADDSSFANMGFNVTPNSPADVCVFIGRNVSIGPNVSCICDSCANNGVEINRFRYVKEKLTQSAGITISDESWIGANATLLPGVTIGRCCVVGAGAVVTCSTDAYGIYAGVPARKMGDVRQWEDAFDE